MSEMRDIIRFSAKIQDLLNAKDYQKEMHCETLNANRKQTNQKLFGLKYQEWIANLKKKEYLSILKL